MSERTVPAENFMQTLHVNVDNKKLSDADFRQFVRNSIQIVKYDPPRQHRVIVDRAGFSQLLRYTCMELECNGATLVRQPYMSDAQWETALIEFKQVHPHTEEE